MKTIRDFDLNNKKVLIRVDFNVPIKDGIIEDDKRIISSLDTIKYAIDNNAKVILLSHLGRIKNEEDKLKNSLKPISTYLSKLLNKEVLFSSKTRGIELEQLISNMKPKDVLLIENTRYEDYPNKLESSNDKELGKYWASLGDIFINDAFGTSHREHASNVGIATNLPCGIGFLIEKELNNLNFDNMEKPITIIMGGSKVSDKIGVIKNLINKCDYLLLGGAMAYTFLYANNMPIGKSLLDKESIDFCKEMLSKYRDKIILPIDSINKENDKIRECFISDFDANEIGYDIGYQTLKLFKSYLEESKTIIWNGPVGMFEDESFEKGTKGICKILNEIECIKIAGGGDTASAIKKFGYEKAFNHISTGGGATLELLEGKKLPGISIIDEKENN